MKNIRICLLGSMLLALTCSVSYADTGQPDIQPLSKIEKKYVLSPETVYVTPFVVTYQPPCEVVLVRRADSYPGKDTLPVLGLASYGYSVALQPPDWPPLQNVPNYKIDTRDKRNYDPIPLRIV